MNILKLVVLVLLALSLFVAPAMNSGASRGASLLGVALCVGVVAVILFGVGAYGPRWLDKLLS